MTIQPAAAPNDAKPLAWWVTTASSDDLPYPDTPLKTALHHATCAGLAPRLLNLWSLPFGRFAARPCGLGYPQGPHRLVYGDRLGPVWITLSTGVGCLTQKWGIYLTLGVGNMVTLDTSRFTSSAISESLPSCALIASLIADFIGSCASSS